MIHFRLTHPWWIQRDFAVSFRLTTARLIAYALRLPLDLYFCGLKFVAGDGIEPPLCPNLTCPSLHLRACTCLARGCLILVWADGFRCPALVITPCLHLRAPRLSTA